MEDDRRAIVGSALLGGLFALIAILGVSRGNVRDMTIGDGLIYRYVAAHFAQDPADVHSVVVKRGTSLRYGRAGLPAAIWLASAGQPRAMRYAQPIIMVLCGAALAGAARALFPAAPWPGVLSPFLAAGVTLAITGGFAEAMAAAAGVWAVILTLRDRWWAASGLLAVALLARENAGAILLGLVAWQLVRKRWATAGVLALSLAPTIAWHAYVRAAYGHWPFFDPYLREETSTIGAPFVAIYRSLVHSDAPSAATAAIHLALALAAFVLAVRRPSPLSMVAAAAGIQVLMAGPFSWFYVGESVRAFCFLQLFLLLALVARFTSASEQVGASEPAAHP